MTNQREFTASQPMNWGVDATLDITEYEHGYLMAVAEWFLDTLLDDGDIDDEWHGVTIDGKVFDINIWYDEDINATRCTVYSVNSETLQTDTSLYGRLW